MPGPPTTAGAVALYPTPDIEVREDGAVAQVYSPRRGPTGLLAKREETYGDAPSQTPPLGKLMGKDLHVTKFEFKWKPPEPPAQGTGEPWHDDDFDEDDDDEPEPWK